LTYGSGVFLEERRAIDGDFDKVFDLSYTRDVDGGRKSGPNMLSRRSDDLDAEVANGDSSRGWVGSMASIVKRKLQSQHQVLGRDDEAITLKLKGYSYVPGVICTAFLVFGSNA